MRVIAGSARSVPLSAPKGFDTRPTADAVRESVFNILQTRIAGASVLDLFAGTGAFGVEALSRGAGRAVFVDNSSECADVIAKNLAKTRLNGDSARVIKADAFTYLSTFGGEPFDVVFADPPYGQTDAFFGEMFNIMAKRRVLADDGALLIERRKTEGILESEKFVQTRVKVYGQAKIIFMEWGGGIK